jgi:hypothetical protein
MDRGFPFHVKQFVGRFEANAGRSHKTYYLIRSGEAGCFGLAFAAA